MKDYYYILGVSKEATIDDIKKAYRKLSMKFHPDQNNGDKFFEERFKDIKEAYETLTDTSQREKYHEEFFRSSETKKENYQSTNTASNTNAEPKKERSNSKTKTSSSNSRTKTKKKPSNLTPKPIISAFVVLLILILAYNFFSKNSNPPNAIESNQMNARAMAIDSTMVVDTNIVTIDYAAKIPADQSNVAIGDMYEGGIVFFKKNNHIRIVTPYDLALVGTINNDFKKAKKACSDLNINGTKGWYLPEAAELDLIFTNLKKNRLGNFIYNSYYLSSTPNERGEPEMVNFSLGWTESGGDINNTKFHVRAVRKIGY